MSENMSQIKTRYPFEDVNYNRIENEEKRNYAGYHHMTICVLVSLELKFRKKEKKKRVDIRNRRPFGQLELPFPQRSWGLFQADQTSGWQGQPVV